MKPSRCLNQLRTMSRWMNCTKNSMTTERSMNLGDICSNRHHATRPMALRNVVASNLPGRSKRCADTRSTVRSHSEHRFHRLGRMCQARCWMIQNFPTNCCQTIRTKTPKIRTMSRMTIPRMNRTMNRWNLNRRKNSNSTTMSTSLVQNSMSLGSNRRQPGRLPTCGCREATWPSRWFPLGQVGPD